MRLEDRWCEKQKTRITRPSLQTGDSTREHPPWRGIIYFAQSSQILMVPGYRSFSCSLLNNRREMGISVLVCIKNLIVMSETPTQYQDELPMLSTAGIHGCWRSIWVSCLMTRKMLGRVLTCESSNKKRIHLTAYCSSVSALCRYIVRTPFNKMAFGGTRCINVQSPKNCCNGKGNSFENWGVGSGERSKVK